MEGGRGVTSIAEAEKNKPGEDDASHFPPAPNFYIVFKQKRLLNVLKITRYVVSWRYGFALFILFYYYFNAVAQKAAQQRKGNG